MLFVMLLLTGCRNAEKKEHEIISFEEYDFTKIDCAVIVNVHTGSCTYITNQNDINEICDFIKKISGKDGISSKGYYEGTYSLELQENDQTVFEIGFGDNPVFHFGEYEEGYPVRYSLVDCSIEEITGFFSRFED